MSIGRNCNEGDGEMCVMGLDGAIYWMNVITHACAVRNCLSGVAARSLSSASHLVYITNAGLSGIKLKTPEKSSRARMATKQQLKTQLDVLREENQRLEGMLQQLPQRSPLTPRMLSRSEKAREEAVTRELSTVREENEQLRQEILEQKERARLAEQERRKPALKYCDYSRRR